MKDLSSLALDLYRACREMAVDRYRHWAIERLKQYVPFDAAMWASGHFGDRGPVIHNVVLANRPPAMLADYEHIKHEDPLAADVALHPGISCVANAIPEYPSLSRETVSYLLKWRIINAISNVIVDPLTGLLTAVGLYREDRAMPFTEAERCFHEDTMPHLIETHAANRIAHIARSAQPRNAAIYASAAVDGHGQLQCAPDNFQRLLLAEWPGWRGHQLPKEVKHLTARKRGSHFVGKRVFFRSMQSNGIFLVQAREKRAADELTVRELEVARLAANGLTYREVAKRLGISPTTVRNHLSAIYGKLKVRKQPEIVPLLRDID